jgi:hypothetical protein
MNIPRSSDEESEPPLNIEHGDEIKMRDTLKASRDRKKRPARRQQVFKKKPVASRKDIPVDKKRQAWKKPEVGFCTCACTMYC